MLPKIAHCLSRLCRRECRRRAQVSRLLRQQCHFRFDLRRTSFADILRLRQRLHAAHCVFKFYRRICRRFEWCRYRRRRLQGSLQIVVRVEHILRRRACVGLHLISPLQCRYLPIQRLRRLLNLRT